MFDVKGYSSKYSNSGVINARSGIVLSNTSFQTRLYATMLGKYIANALKQQREESAPAKKAEKKVSIIHSELNWADI